MKNFVFAGRINLNKNYYKLVFIRDHVYSNTMIWQNCNMRVNGVDEYCYCYITKNQEEYNKLMWQINKYNNPIYKIINKNDIINIYYVFNLDTWNKSLYIIDEDIYNQK